MLLTFELLIQVSLLINNAGVVSGLHLVETPDHLIERSFNVNVLAHFWVSSNFLLNQIPTKNSQILSTSNKREEIVR